MITITAIELSVARGMLTPAATSISASFPAKLSAAKALARKPDSVMATCMVARNFAGSAVSFLSFPARLSPCSSSFESFASFTEITAISAEANTALRNIRMICNIKDFNFILLKNTKQKL